MILCALFSWNTYFSLLKKICGREGCLFRLCLLESQLYHTQRSISLKAWSDGGCLFLFLSAQNIIDAGICWEFPGQDSSTSGFWSSLFLSLKFSGSLSLKMPQLLHMGFLELSLSFSQIFRQSLFEKKNESWGAMSLPVQIPLWIKACSKSVLTKIKVPMSGSQNSGALFPLKNNQLWFFQNQSIVDPCLYLSKRPLASGICPDFGLVNITQKRNSGARICSKYSVSFLFEVLPELAHVCFCLCLLKKLFGTTSFNLRLLELFFPFKHRMDVAMSVSASA